MHVELVVNLAGLDALDVRVAPSAHLSVANESSVVERRHLGRFAVVDLLDRLILGNDHADPR